MPDKCGKCGLPYTQDVHAAEFSIDHEGASQVKTCVTIESENGRAVAHVFYHTEADLEEPEQEERPDADELTGDHLAVFRVIKEASAAGGAIKLGELRGAVASNDIPPDECKTIVADLLDEGHVEETTDAVFKVPQEAEASA